MSKLIYIIIFIVSLVLLLVPLLTKNHIYEGVALGGDTARVFVPFIVSATEGSSLPEVISQGVAGGLALGITVVMWCLGVVNRVFQISPEILFYLYSTVALLGVGISLYYLGKLIDNKRTGWIVVVMSLLCGTSILTLYSVACILNIINLYIVFIWSIIFIVKWITGKEWYWLIAGILSSLLFIILHQTGIYLPLTIFVAVIGWVVWRIYKKRQFKWWWVASALFILSVGLYISWGSIASVSPVNNNYLDPYSFYIVKAIRLFFVPVPTIIGILVGIAWWRHRKDIGWESPVLITLFILGSLLSVLVVASILRITVVAERQVVDATGILSIIIAIILGRLISEKGLYWLKFTAYSLMAMGSAVTILMWVR